MTPTEQDKELRECFSCKKQKIVNEHWLCSECKSEIRTIDDTWLVQEFRKWYSDDEVVEAINQIKQTILFGNDTLITADRKRVALEKEEMAFRYAIQTLEDTSKEFTLENLQRQLDKNLAQQEEV